MDDQLCLTRDQLIRIFEEWEWRFRNSPDEFVDEEEKAECTPWEYGQRSAKYFWEIFDDLNSQEGLPTP